MNKKIWVIGSQNIDTTYFVKTIPSIGHTVAAESYMNTTGGKGANQAIAAAHFGASVSFVGCVGDDAEGRVLLESLQESGIETNYIKVVADKSGNAVIYVDQQGANCIVVYPGANCKIPISLLPEFKKNDIVLAQLEVNEDAVQHGFELAKKAGSTTVLNLSPVKEAKEIIKLTDILVVNESEASVISGMHVKDMTSAEKCIKRIIEKGPEKIVITLGELGVICFDGEKVSAIDGVEVKVIDTQGAGDAFLGALVYKLSTGSELVNAARFANKVGAFAVTRKGTTKLSLPKDINSF